MAIASGDGITQAQAIAATNAARKQADAAIATAAAAKTPKTPKTPTVPKGAILEPEVVPVKKTPTGPKFEVSRTTNADGSVTLFYSDKSSETLGGKKSAESDYAAMDAANKQAERVSAFNILKDEFTKYGLGSLVDGIKNLLQDGTPASEFSLKLRETPEYLARFKANEARIAAGLSALSPAEYVALEDQYQNVMRNYGLPPAYYTKDATGKQVGFEKFIAGDVSATELEDRISTAQKRVINANPEVSAALKAFYPDITNGDILAYTLDPTQGLESIKRKVTAAEIGGAAMAQKLSTSAERAMQLAGYGVTKEQAQQGFQTVASVAPRGSQLADIYRQGPYGQAEAETEVFGLAGSEEASARRKKLAALEKSSFSGSAGASKGALERERVSGAGAI